MKKTEQLKKAYLGELECLLNEYKQNSIGLAENNSEDEAVLEKIKMNICDIFLKMFNVSYNKSCRNLVGEEEEMDKLKVTYLDFFEKIPLSWKEKMEKDRAFNMMEEFYKEEIKLETADKLKRMFLEHYERV
jgi:hypothetical protein